MARAPYVGIHVRSPRPGHKLSARHIVDAVAEEIRAGRLPAGCRLPPVRVMEHQLGLSKNTVQVAYDELVARGLLETRLREGVFVAAVPEGAAPPTRAARPPRLATRSTGTPDRPAPDAPVGLSTVFIDPELLPRDKLAECMRSVLHARGLEPQYHPQGLPALREAIAARLSARGMEVTADEVIVTQGSQQALDIVARVLAERRVAVEDPVYSHARRLFESHGLEVTGLPLDPFGGVDLGDWEARLTEVRPGLLYAISSFQNPTGYSYSTHELVRILALAERLGFAILEDDWGSDMLSGSDVRPSLRLLGGPEVLYCNSFTKKLLPSLRLGFLVASAPLIPSLVNAKRIATLGNSSLLEATLAEFLERGYFDGHLAALQAELDDRYGRCLGLLRELMPDGVRWTTPGGGPTLWLDLPARVDLVALQARCLARGVGIEVPEAAHVGAARLHGFRVSFAFLPPDVLRGALGVLSEEIRR